MLSSRMIRKLPTAIAKGGILPSSRTAASYQLVQEQHLHYRLYTRTLSTCLPSPLFSLKKKDDGEDRYRNFALPRISLHQPPQNPLMMKVQPFSSTRTTDEQKKDDPSTTSFTERIAARIPEDRKEQGLLAMANGKELAKKYGPVFFGTYLGVYFGTLGLLFLGIESGAMDPASILSMVSDNADEAKSTVQVIVDFMENHTITRPWTPFVERNPEIANLAVAWIATKFTEPIRLVVSAAIVPTVHRTLGYVDKRIEEERSQHSAEKEEENSAKEETKEEGKDSSK